MALEVEKTEFSAEIRISDPEQMQAFLDEETNILKEMVDKVKSSGANVLLCQKGIDDVAQHFLAKEGIAGVRRIKESDMEKLARATGGKVVTNIEGLSNKELGEAGLMEERRMGEDKMVFIEECKNPRSVSILIRAGLERSVDEAERAINDALFVISDIVSKNKIVVGGGATEVEIAKRIKEYASKIGGREQLAIEKFAEGLESIPKYLAENAGLDPVDIMVALKAAHAEATGQTTGIDVYSGKTKDMLKEGIIEPIRVKEHAIRSAVESASMILRIDDVIAAAKSAGPPPGGPGGGMPPGMGGMPPGMGGMPPGMGGMM
jgi:chaperonin GroEL (HSP60 family)